MKHAPVNRFGMIDVRVGGIESKNHHIDALKAHHAERFRPPAVVANTHADDSVKRPIDLEAAVSNFEVSLLQVLKRQLRPVVGVPGQMDLAVLSNDRSVGRNKNCGVEAPLSAVFVRE